MKKTVLILALLVGFISYQGFANGGRERKALDEKITKIGQDITDIKEDITDINGKTPVHVNPDPKPEPPQRIPVTYQIVEFLLENNANSEGLKFYPSKEFFLEIYEKKETDKIENNKGKIVINPVKNADEPNEIRFPADSEGTLAPMPGPDKDKELQIFFQKQGKTLIFKRNVQLNCYELSDVNEINKDYKIKASEPIQLCVSGEDKRKVEVHAVPVDFVTDNCQPPSDSIAHSAQSYQKIPAVDYSIDYNRSVYPSKSVMGPSSLKREGVIAYVSRSKRIPALSAQDIKIIDTYFREAREEGVNVDIAIAQMLYWTDNLRNRERVASCNYGGLSSIDGFKGRFPYRMKDGMTEGVRAHIQHLMAYARVTPKRDKVDPRYPLAFERGSRGITFDQVYRSWSVSPYYGQEIEDKLFELYQFSNVL